MAKESRENIRAQEAEQKRTGSQIISKDTQQNMDNELKLLNRQNEALKIKLKLLKDIALQERLEERQSQLGVEVESAEFCAACHAPLSMTGEQVAISEQKNRLLIQQLDLLDDIYRAEKKVTEETEKQLTLEQLKEQQKEAYFKKYGQSVGMRAASAGVDLSRVTGTSEAYAAGDPYTRQSGEQTIIFTGNKSGL